MLTIKCQQNSIHNLGSKGLSRDTTSTAQTNPRVEGPPVDLETRNLKHLLLSSVIPNNNMADKMLWEMTVTIDTESGKATGFKSEMIVVVDLTEEASHSAGDLTSGEASHRTSSDLSCRIPVVDLTDESDIDIPLIDLTTDFGHNCQLSLLEMT